MTTTKTKRDKIEQLIFEAHGHTEESWAEMVEQIKKEDPKAFPKPKRKAPVPKRKRGITSGSVSWNYRIVRRHHKGYSWIVITEVHYRGGRPEMFVFDPCAPQESIANAYEKIGEPEAIQRLRWTLEQMQTALSQPVLDEIEDFKGEHSD